MQLTIRKIKFWKNGKKVHSLHWNQIKLPLFELEVCIQPGIPIPIFKISSIKIIGGTLIKISTKPSTFVLNDIFIYLFIFSIKLMYFITHKTFFYKKKSSKFTIHNKIHFVKLLTIHSTVYDFSHQQKKTTGHDLQG